MDQQGSPSGAAQSTSAADEARRGVIFAVCAYTIWGASAAFFGSLDHIPPAEVVAHRIIWSVPVALTVLLVIGRTSDILPALRSPRILAVLMMTTVLVTFNWGLYVWAVMAGRALDASLGYFINPLVSVALGYVLLGERLQPGQKVAVGLAVLAVVVQTWLVGIFPWVSLGLAGSFALYGYARKTVNVGPAQGFLIEVLLALVPALVIALWVLSSGSGVFLSGPVDTLLLAFTGVFTATPLIIFAAAAKRLRLVTLGLLQYIAPSLIFLTAVFLFGEQMGFWRWVSFAMIWLALAIFSISTLRAERRKVSSAKP